MKTYKFFIMILFTNFLLAETPMTFLVKHDVFNDLRAEIYASGDITQGTALTFINFIKTNNIGVATVYFDSYGGSLIEGITLGEIIRKMGYDTSIGTTQSKLSGVCASACTYAFAGGVARYIYDDRQKLGLHQFYSIKGSQGNISTTQNTAALVAKHLSDMGVGEEAFILASSTHSTTMKWLTKEEAKRMNFANNGKNETTAEIKLMTEPKMKQKPYLKIEQIRAEGTGNLLFYCINDTMYLQAAIITNSDTASRHGNNVKRNYLELDDGIFLAREGSEGLRIKNDTLWFKRKLYSNDINRILHSKVLNMWIEEGGTMRWGLQVDIYPIKEKMTKFLRSCTVPNMDMDTTLSYF